MTWPDVWYGETASAKALRLLLTPLSWLYAAGWTAYRAMYDLGFKKPKSPYAPILVVGNLTVGGSGKTPLTALVARELLSQGRPVTISCSGYGGRRTKGATFAPEGHLDSTEWGDEPALLRRLLPGLPLIVGRGRVAAAELMAGSSPAPGAVLLLDDGFQHLPLAKTASVLMDRPSENRACLPAGPYREPRSNLRRADLVLPDSEFELRDEIVGCQPLLEFQAGGVDRDDLAGRTVDAVCAIGRPRAFRDSLELAGLRVRKLWALPDHASFEGFDWGQVQSPVVVTAKDAVKLKAPPVDVFVALHEIVVEPAEDFRERLRKLVDQQ